MLRNAARITGPVVALAAASLIEIPGHAAAPAMLGVAAWMAIWWISECVPLAFTALIPLIAFPLLGISTGREVAPKYINSIIFLFLGGFLIAQAMERTNLHRRIAMTMLTRLHANPLALAAGFAIATAFLSMWISNTATTMLMVTIALPLLHRLMEEHGEAALAPMAASFLIIIAYSANLGGMGTPVGTAPNLVFLEITRTQTPAHTLTFLQWMMIGVPVMLAGLAILFLLQGRALTELPWKASDAGALEQSRAELGAMRREEKYVAGVLALAAILWMTRQGIHFESFSIPGWAALLPYPGIDDGTVSIFCAGLLFLLKRGDGEAILDTDSFRALPWDVVVLLGGGFALAFGMQHSGLSSWIGDQLAILKAVPLPLMMIGIALGITFLTEITSNTAITQVMLPILAAVALANTLDPLLVLLPATLAASCAFMLPVATPPNAIVFGSRHVPMQAMVKAGIRMNLIMAVVIVGLVMLLRPLLVTS